ncbi:YHS domain-containing (seleno)protein [Gammaproteobacteria bacterium]|nr:YHS domain-containing (seleno)protein [Gammaproteobacteria bacterium]
MNRRSLIALGAAIPLAAKATSIDPIYTGWLSKQALQGYDPVAYFSLEPGSPPVKGDEAYRVEWRGAQWLFSSAQNLDKFTANPERYAPRYGGYCAWAMGEGETAKGDANVWAIVRRNADGSVDEYTGSGDRSDYFLYLNYDNDIAEQWKADIAGFIERADHHWKTRFGLDNPYDSL